jgi:hypothetical protein
VCQVTLYEQKEKAYRRVKKGNLTSSMVDGKEQKWELFMWREQIPQRPDFLQNRSPKRTKDSLYLIFKS